MPKIESALCTDNVYIKFKNKMQTVHTALKIDLKGEGVICTFCLYYIYLYTHLYASLWKVPQETNKNGCVRNKTRGVGEEEFSSYILSLVNAEPYECITHS